MGRTLRASVAVAGVLFALTLLVACGGDDEVDVSDEQDGSTEQPESTEATQEQARAVLENLESQLASLEKLSALMDEPQVGDPDWEAAVEAERETLAELRTALDELDTAAVETQVALGEVIAAQATIADAFDTIEETMGEGFLGDRPELVEAQLQASIGAIDAAIDDIEDATARLRRVIGEDSSADRSGTDGAGRTPTAA